ncbi:hypothetical protein PF010_g23967 [Phytophthora fragariae]|uniref:Uncharacterized protein n=1 Tax=Phytophthora fragariae TaxID=53985 RepID=A0A6G0QPT0_9STRA|nr:hypothetical protein PF010_g23967 [Phytophthora fragariae]KAE9296199.1 hypothetical protein PF008_g24073 [Phytophthora fragariae]
MPSSPLEALSATLLTADASERELQDVDWSLVSAALAVLRLRTQEELTELAAALDPPAAAVRVDTVEEHDELLAVHTELKSLQPQLTVVEQHFAQLESIVRPGLNKLQRLRSRAKYLEAAVQVEKLSQEAKNIAIQATPDALEAFKNFAAFAAAIPEQFTVIRREAARRVEGLSVDLRRFAVEKLQLALEKINWPEPLTTQQEIAEKEVELRELSKAFGYLLTLQLSQQSQPVSATTDLWAMECVLDPLLQRFRYHFERPESATNRLAKPEWYLSHVQEQTNVHTRFLAHTLTPELHRHREEVHCWDAQILLLRGLIKAASRKLAQDLPTLLAHPPLLCHTLDEVLLFEQTIDDDVEYGSWASADRRAYPRCVDVFTSSNDVLFSWTSADVEYAHRVLSSSLEDEASRNDFDFSVSRGKRESIWKPEDEVYGRHEGSVPGLDQDLVPPGWSPAALRFVSLLDFLYHRFTLMETEEHRYLYVVQVHLPLLRQFGQICDARGRRLINALAKKTSGAKAQNAWEELFVVVNALQHVAHALAAWEQSSVFLELSRKVARSETTRAQVLRMHVAYSKQVLARASAAVLATEEATAVRQALAGPGAMIGPTAAFSVAYSVGSKTMKSLFRRAETDGKTDEQVGQGVSVDTSSPAAAPNGNGSDGTSINNHPLGDPELDDPETLLFSHTIFERQISELKALATTLLEGGKDTLVRAVERDVGAYRLSSFWTDTKYDDADNSDLHIVPGVSSELASCYTLVSNTLRCAHKVLVPECWPALLKPLASALDSALFNALYNPPSTDECSQLSRSGEHQFVEDIRSLVAIFAAGSSKTLPRSYLRLTREVCHLLEMPATRLREVYKALDDEPVASADGVEAAEGLEQLTTILEACSIFALRPAQVVRICATRLDLEGREAPTS